MRRMHAWSRERLAIATLLFVPTLAPHRDSFDAQIIPRQGIEWGVMMPGVPVRVTPQNEGQRGQIDFVGQDNFNATLVFPANLTSLKGDRLAVSVQTGDLMLQYTRNGGTSFPDPTLPISIHTNSGQGDAMLFIGGTASPAPTQAPGSYAGLVRVVIVRTTL
ncbi:MAG TPA: hypothetical protein VN706_14145 [Gemmatimonadaceae bacterium]|nr:hypothetical protein [Gemmatimonadaceae bacterium]